MNMKCMSKSSAIQEYKKEREKQKGYEIIMLLKLIQWYLYFHNYSPQNQKKRGYKIYFAAQKWEKLRNKKTKLKQIPDQQIDLTFNELLFLNENIHKGNCVWIKIVGVKWNEIDRYSTFHWFYCKHFLFLTICNFDFRRNVLENKSEWLTDNIINATQERYYGIQHRRQVLELLNQPGGVNY